jgi:hypothetical protein
MDRKSVPQLAIPPLELTEPGHVRREELLWLQDHYRGGKFAAIMHDLLQESAFTESERDQIFHMAWTSLVRCSHAKTTFPPKVYVDRSTVLTRQPTLWEDLAISPSEPDTARG